MSCNEVTYFFFQDHVVFSVYTTKTRGKGKEKLLIPVYCTSTRGFCVRTLLYSHFLKYTASPDSPILFKCTHSGMAPLMYKDVLNFLKDCVILIGLQGSIRGGPHWLLQFCRFSMILRNNTE